MHDSNNEHRNVSVFPNTRVIFLYIHYVKNSVRSQLNNESNPGRSFTNLRFELDDTCWYNGPENITAARYLLA